jgi:predicted nucleotidyltransferase
VIGDEKPFSDAIIERFLSLILPLGKNIKEVYLFGSRCRDDWRPDSDYDILIVVDRKDRDLISKLYDAVMDILLDTGRLISLKIFIASEFNRLKSIPTPFMNNVIKEGIKLGPHH